jgi:uncharacterized repeat protein (TIGR01451 family)
MDWYTLSDYLQMLKHLVLDLKATLPTGLKFDHATITSGNGGMNYTAPAGPAAGATGAIAWNFGTVLNPSNGVTADDTITIDYWVTVANLPGNIQGLTLNIPAHIEYTDGPGNNVVKADQTAGISLVEPQLAISKTGPAEVTLQTPATFSIVVQNNGQGTAWQTALTDTLPAEMRAQAPVITGITVGSPSSFWKLVR